MGTERMRWGRTRWLTPGMLARLVLLLLGLGPSGASVQAQEPCLKLVFNRYCLGGDIKPLLQQQPAVSQHDGERLALVFYDGTDRIYVLGLHGRVYKVLRQYRTTTQLRFEELYGLLRNKYGPGEDRSRFPSYATTPGRKMSAIRRGEGLAMHAWETDGGWRIELAWTRELGLSLAYVADELDQQQQSLLEGGY